MPSEQHHGCYNKHKSNEQQQPPPQVGLESLPELHHRLDRDDNGRLPPVAAEHPHLRGHLPPARQRQGEEETEGGTGGGGKLQQFLR